MSRQNPHRFVGPGLAFAVLAFVINTSFALTGPQTPSIQVHKAVAPPYPAIARAARASGVVTVEVLVDAAGAVSKARGTSGHPLLRAAAEEAAKRWQFATDRDATAERRATLTITFAIMPECTKYADLTPIFSPPYQVEVRAEPLPIICDDCPPQPDPCKNVKR